MNRSKQIRAIFAALLFLGACLNLFGQSERGTFAGTVTDASGAAIPGAKVTITNVNTQEVITTVSNDTGDFTVPNIPIGNYNVRIEREGFNSELRSNITMNASATVRVDAQLKLGETRTTVEVQAAA